MTLSGGFERTDNGYMFLGSAMVFSSPEHEVLSELL